MANPICLIILQVSSVLLHMMVLKSQSKKLNSLARSIFPYSSHIQGKRERDYYLTRGMRIGESQDLKFR